MIAHGHHNAARYPLGRMMDEARLVVERVNLGHATDATLVQMAVSGVLDKKANKDFRKVIKTLTGE